MGACHYAPDGWCDDPKCVEGCKKRRPAASPAPSQRINFDGTPHVCSFNADGRCTTHAFSKEAPLTSNLETRDPTGWREFIENVIAGKNYFRAGEYMELLKQLEEVTKERDQLRSAAQALKIRIAYIGHPAEAMRTPHDRPVPDWRNEIAILEAALSGDSSAAAQPHCISCRCFATEIQPSASETSAPSRGSIEYAIEVLKRYRDGSDPDCTCDDCPQCGRLPAECSGTQCAQTCQCSECDHCRVLAAIDGLKGRIHDFGPNRCAECQTPRLCGVERECLRNRYVRPSVQETSTGLPESLRDPIKNLERGRELIEQWGPTPVTDAALAADSPLARAVRIARGDVGPPVEPMRFAEKASADLCNGQALANCVKSPEHDGPCESRAGIQWPKPAMRCKHGKDWLGCRQCDREYLEATKCIACGHGNEYHFEDNYGNIVCRWSAECACVHRADSFPNGKGES